MFNKFINDSIQQKLNNSDLSLKYQVSYFSDNSYSFTLISSKVGRCHFLIFLINDFNLI